MIRHRFFFKNIQKEEDWINRFVAQGYRLKNLTPGRYQFEKQASSKPMENLSSENGSQQSCLPLVKIDFRTFSNLADFKDYLASFENAGWHHIAGNRSEGPQYFEKKRPDCSQEIFSDSNSSANRYRRITYLNFGLFSVHLALLIVIFTNLQFAILSISSWKELYHTPELWKLTGLQFWGAFLRETPLALIRGGFPILIITIFIFYFGFPVLSSLYWSWKEKRI